jgi:hypothetical protein
MRLFISLGGKTGTARQVKSAARWSTNHSIMKVSDAKDLVWNKLKAHDPITNADCHDTQTRIESANRKFSCLNEVFAELIQDDCSLGFRV